MYPIHQQDLPFFCLTVADSQKTNTKFTPKEVTCQEWRRTNFSNTAVLFCGTLSIHISENQNHEIQSPFHHLEGNTVVLGGSDGKDSACNERNLCSIPGSVRSPGEGNSYPLQYSCLENSMDRGVWWATVHGVTKSRTWWATNTCTFHFFHVALPYMPGFQKG